MLKKVSNFFVGVVEKFLPDAFIFSVVLTVISFVMAMIFTHQSFLDVVGHWAGGFWKLLAFSMQMALVLVLGSAFASSKPVKKVLKKIARVAKTPTQAIMTVSIVSGICCWLNWGFGLIVGALLAKELARNVKGVDYRLLIASAYSGFVVWHNGVSGSIPLQVASDAEQLSKFSGGLITELIPITDTIFSPANLIMCAAVILTLPILNSMMHPDPDKTITVDPKLLEEEDIDDIEVKNVTPADKLENSVFITGFIVVTGIIYLVRYFMEKGFDLNLNIVNFIFLIVGMLCHKTPIRYVKAIGEAVKGSGGILLQFPFYAGIMVIMTGANAEEMTLAGVISNGFVSISTPKTFPLFTYWAAGLVNFFVPSGGGQWAVQGPIMLPSAVKLGVSPALTCTAIAMGDAWTNMIQPFWALPALGLAGLGAKDIMGYCIIVLLWVGFIMGATLLIVA